MKKYGVQEWSYKTSPWYVVVPRAIGFVEITSCETIDINEQTIQEWEQCPQLEEAEQGKESEQGRKTRKEDKEEGGVMKRKWRLTFKNEIVMKYLMLLRGTEDQDREVAIGFHKLQVTVDLEKSRFSEIVGRKP